MLDFSRLERAGRQGSYQPVKLADLTAELASNFRSLCEKAGLQFKVHCADFRPEEPAFVDPDMWEIIVLNLLSNAFKFTLQGMIEVRLEALDRQAVLTVRDNGVGIPPEELPRKCSSVSIGSSATEGERRKARVLAWRSCKSFPSSTGAR